MTAESGEIIGRLIDQIARVSDADLVLTLKTALGNLHRLFDRSYLKIAADLLAARSQHPITVAEVGLALQDLPIIAPGQTWIKPPVEITTTLTIPTHNGQSPRYPKDLLFSVDVQVEMRRDKALIHGANQAGIDDLPAAAKPQVEAVSAYFAPKTLNLTTTPTAANGAEGNAFSDRIASLTPFAEAFEQALPGLKLAVGRQGGNIDSTNPENSDSLWAVHLGDSGIRYAIDEDFPYFFAAAPLSNTPWAGDVAIYHYSADSGLNPENPETRRVDAVDLNALGRIYLQALETVLQPEIAIPAANDAALNPFVERLLTVKARLATAISQQVIPVLESTLNADSPGYRERQGQAAAALHKALLANLADAYDIETIVQYNVNVIRTKDYHWPANSTAHQPPRLSGQPMITRASYIDPSFSPNANSTAVAQKALLQSLDFALSPAKIALNDTADQSHSTLTFFFNTETPQRYEGIKVTLAYEVNELEYDINPAQATSSWLNFVVPLPQVDIKDVQIPIPLRDFPMPPSLIGHNAVPDPDGFAGDVLNADNIRDWNYVFLYEHPDVAQDTIECRIEYNDVSRLTIDNVIVREGEPAVFTVTLSPPSATTVTVAYTTQDGTARHPRDYSQAKDTLIFAPGDTTRTIQIEVKNDDIVENLETFTVILSNADQAEIADAVGVGIIIDTTREIAPLTDTLVRFNELYPAIASDLETLATQPVTPDHRHALTAFVTLVEDVAQSWQVWQSIAIAQPERRTVHYTIDEQRLNSQDRQPESESDPAAGSTSTKKVVAIKPTDNLPDQHQKILKIDLPGYRLDRASQDDRAIYPPNAPDPKPGSLTDVAFLPLPYKKLAFEFSPKTDTSEIETFGDSALPDRRITVIDLDILEHQNAWAGICLTRNQNLIDDWKTNPAFIFQTPEVRFKDPLTPLIINDKRWDVAALSSGETTLAEHLQALFQTLLPPDIKRLYDLIITGQYAFSLATQQNPVHSASDLLATLPVFLTPRFTVRQPTSSLEGVSAMLTATQLLRDNIATTMQHWWRDNQAPNATGGRFVFSVSLLSHPDDTPSDRNPNLPLLVVENLELKLTDISDRTTWLEGTGSLK